MSVTFLEPTAERGVEIAPYELFADTSGPLRIGLLANAFPDGTRFMDKLEAVLSESLPLAAFQRYQKPDVGVVADDLAAQIIEECDVVLAAWGH